MAKKFINPRCVNKNNAFMTSPSTYWEKRGAALWNSLSNEILNKEGKEIVSVDPSLSIATLKKLIETCNRPLELEKYDCMFGDSDNPEDFSDIGSTLLSSCIRDNLSATRAELVARFASIIGIPFIETAIMIMEREQSPDGLFLYDLSTGERIRWTPKEPSPHKIYPKSFAQKTDITNEWDLLDDL